MDDKAQKTLRIALYERIKGNPRIEAETWERHLNEVLLIFCRKLRWIPEQDGYALVDDTDTYVFCSQSLLRLYRQGKPPESIVIPNSYFPFPKGSHSGLIEKGVNNPDFSMIILTILNLSFLYEGK